MELKTIITYQDADIKLRKLLDIIEKSDDNKRMEQARQEFNAARQHILDCEKEAEKLLESYTESEKQFTEAAAKLEEMELIIENLDDDEQLPQFIQDTEKLRSRIIELERKLSDLKQRSEKVLKDYKDAGDRGKKMRDIHNASKERLDALRKEKDAEIFGLKKQLLELEPSIDQELLEKYKSLTAEGKYPAIVDAHEDGSTFSCRGCGLALSQKTKSELVDKGICRCETCRRIIIRK